MKICPNRLNNHIDSNIVNVTSAITCIAIDEEKSKLEEEKTIILQKSIGVPADNNGDERYCCA